MKRIASGVLALIFTLALMLPGAAFASEPPETTTPYICLMDANTGSVLYEKSARDKTYPASTTKIMTCILALEMCENLYEVVNVGTGYDVRGSLMSFVNNEELRVIDLIYGTMMVSGNDAAYVLARHIAGSESAFASLMNQKAAEIGMENTHFVKSNGLHKDDHYSTAYDMALLGRYAMQNEAFREIVGSEYFDVPPSKWDSDGYHLENSNRLIHMMEKDEVNYKYPYATGIKTGDTDQAGRCLVAAAKKDGVELILVSFGDPQGSAGKNIRYVNAQKYFDWGFANYATLSVSELGLESSVTIPVSNASFEGGSLTAAADLSGKVLAGTRDYINGILAGKDTITTNVTYRNGAASLTAPITSGEEVGTITYIANGQAFLTMPLIAVNSVDEIGNVTDPGPEASPILVDGNEGEDDGSPWLFWILIIIALLAVLMIIRIALLRNSRRRRRRRKGSRTSASRTPSRSRSRSSSRSRSRSRYR
ncbi:MAG: D-alanyl-D-alanine carboxypeptidase [Clostridia bacterium]|nr:D-alanyl-D-alanine carboxypeptidase [Clostridia bacterium]